MTATSAAAAAATGDVGSPSASRPSSAPAPPPAALPEGEPSGVGAGVSACCRTGDERRLSALRSASPSPSTLPPPLSSSAAAAGAEGEAETPSSPCTPGEPSATSSPPPSSERVCSDSRLSPPSPPALDLLPPRPPPPVAPAAAAGPPAPSVSLWLEGVSASHPEARERADQPSTKERRSKSVKRRAASRALTWNAGGLASHARPPPLRGAARQGRRLRGRLRRGAEDPAAICGRHDEPEGRCKPCSAQAYAACGQAVASAMRSCRRTGDAD